MKKLLLVYNPVAGDALFKYQLDDVIEKFQAEDCVVVPYRTRKGGQGCLPDLARAVGAEGVLVSGGDGTLHEIVNVLLTAGLDLPVGIFPSGTANDFASHLGLRGDFAAYARIVARGAVRSVDVGRAGDAYFVNVASAGMLTTVAHRVDAALKNALGKMAYYLKGIGELPGFRPIGVTVEADGRIWREKIFLFLIVNSGTVGGLSNLVPRARIDDGRLDMLMVRQCSVAELMTLFMGILAGSDLMKHKSVIHLQAETIRIQALEAVESDLDGELGPPLPLCVETLPGKLRVFCEK